MASLFSFCILKARLKRLYSSSHQLVPARTPPRARVSPSMAMQAPIPLNPGGSYIDWAWCSVRHVDIVDIVYLVNIADQGTWEQNKSLWIWPPGSQPTRAPGSYRRLLGANQGSWEPNLSRDLIFFWYVNHFKINWYDKGSLQNKFSVKVGILAQPAWPPPASPNVGISKKEKKSNVYFAF